MRKKYPSSGITTNQKARVPQKSIEMPNPLPVMGHATNKWTVVILTFSTTCRKEYEAEPDMIKMGKKTIGYQQVI